MTAPERWRGRLGSYDPRRSGIGFLALTQDARTDPSFAETLRAYGEARLRVFGTTGEMLDRIHSGDLLLAVNVIGSYALARARVDPDLAFVLPRDYALVMTRIALIPKSARHPNAARLFLDHLLSQRGQEILASEANLFAILLDRARLAAMGDRAVVRRCADPTEAEALVSVLASQGIDAIAESGASAGTGPGAGPAPGVAITVPTPSLRDAEEVLRDHERERDEAPAREPPLPSSADPVLAPVAALTAVHAALLWSTAGGGPARLVQVGALAGWPDASEAWRFVTANFLHVGVEHLATNTAYLAVFALGAIRLFGLPWSALVYAAGAVTSSLATLLLLPGEVPSVGASGCVFALAGATIAGRLRLASTTRLPRRERWRFAGLAAILASGAFAANWAAHLGGSVTGAALGLAMPYAGRGPPGAARAAGLAGLAVLALPWIWRLLWWP